MKHQHQNDTRDDNAEYVTCIEACQVCALDCESVFGGNGRQKKPKRLPAVLCCYECLETCLQCLRALARNR
jgi:hypothetical protein